MRQLYLIILLATLVPQPARSATSFYYLDSKKSNISFPFHLFNNILVVDLRINDSKTLKFIFDSGCKSTIIIHPKWLDSFDIPYKPKVYFSGLGLKDSVETIRMDNAYLQAGQLKGEHIPIYILSKDSLVIDNYLGTDVDGIFGAEIFEKYYVHLNYKKRLVELYAKRPNKKLNQNFRKLPVEVRKSKGYLNCTIMDPAKELFLSELLLDTGANVPVIIKNKNPSDLKIDRYVDAEIGEGLNGPIVSRVCRVPRLYLDTFRLDSVVAVFNETPISFRDLNENTLDGNIGNDILNRYDMYFAYPEQAIYLKPTASLKDPFYFNISNIILLQNKTKNGGFIVKSIASDSPPLLAGLQKGDEIIKIDSNKCSDLEMDEALSLLNKRIGKKISIQYLRNNTLTRISYKLASII